MKRLLQILSLILVGYAASAQTYTPVEIKGSRVFMEGKRLTKSEAVSLFSDFHGADRSSEYLRYRSAYKTGLGLTVGGSVLTLGGGFTFVTGVAVVVAGGITIPLFAGVDVIAGTDTSSEYSSEIFGKANTILNVGLFATLGGVAMLVSGIPTLCVYNSRLNHIEEDYNKAYLIPIEVTFGPQRHGFGFALRF